MILSHKFRVSHHDDLTIVCMYRTLFGQRLLHTYAFLWQDTMIDTGLHCCSPQLLDVARQNNIRKVFLTHHHEDHSGGAQFLQKHNIPIYSSPMTKYIMERGFSIKLYQKLIWGKILRCDCEVFHADLKMGDYQVKVIHTPGHCEDHFAFYIPQKKWLFSGDLFLHHRIKYFRGDEDFYKTIASLKQVLQLDFQELFCCHRGMIKSGKDSMKRKLEHLQQIESQVRNLHRQGWGINQIARHFGKPTSIWLSFGDVSAQNMIRAILTGPKPRKGIQKLVNDFQNHSI